MIDYRQKIEEKEITDNLTVSVSVSYDEFNIYLNVDYLNGKFTIEKSFTNNYIGLEELEKAKQQFSSEESVKQYFRI